MQETVCGEAIKKRPKKRLSKYMPRDGLDLDLSVLGLPFDRLKVVTYISSFLDKKATWIDLHDDPVVGEDLHLICKAHVLDSRLINEDEYYDKFLEGLLKEIEMTKIRGPFTDRVGEDPDLSGLTSLALGYNYQKSPSSVIRSVVGLRESRADIRADNHAWPERSYFTLGVHSCKLFNPSKALAYTVEYFGVTRFEKLHLVKG